MSTTFHKSCTCSMNVDQCDDTCTVDCGHCKGQGHPAELRRIEVNVCDLCLSGAGGECHVPGCAFWMTSAPTGAFRMWLRACRILTAIEDGDETRWRQAPVPATTEGRSADG